MLEWLARRAPALCLWLLLIQYIFVNLVFSTYTLNIVLIKDLAAPLLSLFLFLLWLVGEVATRGRWELRPSPVNLPVAAVFLFLVHSAATSPNLFESVEEFSRFFADFMILLALVKFLSDRVWVERYLATIGIGAFLMTGYGISQWMGRDFLETIGKGAEWGFSGWGGQTVFVSTHGNPNFFSGYLIATIPILIGWWASTRRPFLLFSLPVLAAAMGLCVVHGQARGAYLGLGAALFLFLLGLVWNARKLAILAEPLRKRLLAGSAALLLGTGLLTAIVRPDLAAKPFRTVYDNMATLLDPESSYTNAVRLALFHCWLEGAVREPILGRGLGVSNVRMPESRPNWYHHWGVAHNSDHAHNEWFEWLMEGGVVGTTLYVWLNIALFAGWLRTLVRRRGDSDFPLLLGIGLGLFSQIIQSCFDPESRWTGNAVTNWFSSGLMIAWANLPPPEDPRPAAAWDGARPSAAGPAAAWVAAAAIPVLLFAMHSAVRLWRADHHHRNSNYYTEGRVTAQGISAGLAEAEACADLNPYHLGNYYKLAYVYLATNDFEKSLATYRRLQALAPNFAQIHFNLSYLHQNLGNRYGSAWERDRAAIIEDNTRNHLAAAEYWGMLGRTERVLPHLRHALKIDRDDDEGSWSRVFYMHDDIHYRTAQALAGAGDEARAEREFVNALSRNPGHARALTQLIEILSRTGRSDQADSLVAEVVRRDPNSEIASLILADRALRAGNLDAALTAAVRLSEYLPWPEAKAGGENAAAMLVGQIAQTALENHSPRAPLAYALMGRAYAAIGEYERAHLFLGEARRLAPNDPWIEAQFAAVAARRPGGLPSP